MPKTALFVALLLPLAFALGAISRPAPAGPQLAHMVFFELKDHSAEARAKFVASCHKYLSGHEGVQYYSIGTIAEDVVEPNVSVRDFDVSLHLVFDSKESEAKYLKDPRHVKFVEENRESFGKVRVFDTYINPAPAK
ncbi:MAG: Dabb family protein [Isosphaeraceae bacterium]